MKKLKTTKVKVAAPKKTKAKTIPLTKVNPTAKETCDSGACGCDSSRFGKIFFGLILVLFGLFYLGRNLGFLPAINFNFQLFWPILIILVGLLLINRRSRISIVIGVFSALVFMLILTFVVNFSQIQTEYSFEAVMPALRHIEKTKATTTVVTTEDVKLTNLVANDFVSSPFSVEGSARGSWFFEGSFPVKVLDQNGQELGKGIAQAKGEWMTEDFVPFKATVMFTKPTSSAGSLVLQNDNPSGLEANAKQLVLPIRF